MLVLSRKRGEKLVISGDITLTVLEVKGNRVRIGIEAPDHVRIAREELAFWQEIAAGGDGELDPDLERKTDWS